MDCFRNLGFWALACVWCPFVNAGQAQSGEPERYLFYLPGGIVRDLGPEAVSEYYGRYEYHQILDTLRSKGFVVFGEIQPKQTSDKDQVEKLSFRIDSLINSGVPANRITVVGASAGAYLALDIAARLQKQDLNYAILAMCWPDTYKSFADKKICGRFLSIYETSDPHGSCAMIFKNRDCISSFREIALQMKNSHAFLYRPFREWVDPLSSWIKE